MRRRDVGARGEDIAARHLAGLGYTIRERNVRSREGEIDIVAEKDGVLVFVEVRTRRGTSFGPPEESVDARKRERLCALAEGYVAERTGLPSSWRIDVVAIELGPGGGTRRIEVIENITG